MEPNLRPAITSFATGTLLIVAALAMPGARRADAEDVLFSRDVLPVLSDRCFHCHGPDENNREADLRLDVEEDAKADLGGYAAIVPGDVNESEIWRRIVSEDDDERMPPSDSHRKPLSKAERKAIRLWIAGGAQWGKHWSFEKPIRPAVPKGEPHPIDAFVAAKLSENNLQLSEPAPPHTQLRRLSFDLTGFAPTPAALEAFAEGSDQDWDGAIDRVFQSPHYAERMAMWWLDAARYSDSDGFQIDATRENWPWRDWVIEQFQANRPFNEFTIEQFAGDLLPDATDRQKLATCFHRNHMTNGEGGRDPEESRIDYVIDRVNTTGTVWLGLTLGCVQCHSHKFDPISQRDYYSLAAFFNSIDENGKAGMGAKPYLKFTSSKVDDRVTELTTFVEQIESEESAERSLAETRFETWLKDLSGTSADERPAWVTPPPVLSSSDGTEFRVESDQTVQTVGPTPKQDDYRAVITIPESVSRVTGFRIEVLPHASHIDNRFARDGNGEFTLTSVLALGRRKGSPSETQLELAGAVADFQSDKERETEWDRRYANIRDTLNDDARDGWTTEGAETVQPHTGVYELADPWIGRPGDQLVIVLRHRSTHGHANIGRFRISLCTERGETVRRVDGGSPIAELLQSKANKADPKLRKRLLDQYLLGDSDYQIAAQKLTAAKKQLSQLKKEKEPRRVMVLAEREEPRQTHVLVRGVWDAKGDSVQPAVLPSILEWPAEKTKTRLDFANWIVDAENPLTARVVVNHLWQIMFGSGLVRTPEDFGLQGELPTHPKLLDWLAVELIESDWDLQHLLRLIATSKTYRQSSATTDQLLELDPENRLLARAPRFRLPAWMLRDNALRVSGLLNPALGGPPVKPYQPDGVWAEITMGRFDYQPSLGPAQYRRTIYAFWRRSSAPTFLFDSAQRRVCEVGIRRTNTPLHALTLMNDLTMLEASRRLAELATGQTMDTDSGTAWQDHAQELANRVLSRELRPDELDELHKAWAVAINHYEEQREDAVRFCTVGQQPSPSLERAPQLAAWMMTASLLLNLDEAMTRE